MTTNNRADQNATRRLTEATELPQATLPQLLAYGLTVSEEDGLAMDLLAGARGEIEVLSELLEGLPVGANDFDASRLAPVLERLARQVDVGLELLRRERTTERAAPIGEADEGEHRDTMQPPQELS